MSNSNYKQMAVPFALAVLIVTMLLVSNQGAFALAPSIPTITSPATGSTVNTNSFTVTGKADPFVVVILSDENGNDIGSDVSSSTGFWKIDIDPLSGSSSGIAHTITARSIDSDGNVSTPSASISVTVISSIVTTVNTAGSPSAPTISTGIPTPATFHESTPTIKGTGQAFATIDLFNGGTNIGETVADGVGNWAIPISPLADGTYSLTATATDSDGTSASSSAATIIIDTVSAQAATVTAPTITSPTNGQIITDHNPTITGTADPHVSVTVTDENGNELGSTLSSTTGQWSIDTTPIPTGPHTISAQATDANGDTSAVTSISVTRKDSDKVLAPTIFEPEDGSTTDTTTPVIAGSALPGDTILLFNNGHQITTSPPTIIADGDGNWFGSPTSALSTGAHVISAKAKEGIRISAESTQITVTLAGTATPASTVTTPTFNPPFTFTTPTQTITGTSDAGAVISLSDEFGNALGDTTAGGTGAWSVATALTDGSYSVTAASSTSGGLAFSNPATITVITAGTVIPAPPVITSQTTFDTTTPEISGTAAPGVAILLFDSGTLIDSTFSDGTTGDWSMTPALSAGSHSLTAKAQNGAGLSAASTAVTANIIVPPSIPSITGSTGLTTDTPTITGSADLNVAITLYDEFGTILGTGVSNSGTGAWSIVTSSLTSGPHTLTATATNTVGTSDSSAGFPITVAIPGAPGAVTITSSTFFIIATPTITGTSDAGATIHVTDALGNLLATTTASGTGTWSVAPTSALANGLHTITASAIGITDITSSAPQDIIIDVSNAPNVPSITTAEGTIFNTSTQTITGMADTGVTVTLFDGLINKGSTTSDGVTGEWSMSTTLSDGTHTLSAQASNSNGASDLSGGVEITVASTAGLPAIPSITTGELSSFGVANPTIQGTADTSTTSVTLLDEAGNTIGTTTTFSSAGNWQITTSTAMSAGVHTIFATATNGVGTSVKSTGVDIIINLTGPPPAPILTTPTGFGWSTNTPSIIGLSDPGATIAVSDGSTVLSGTVLGPDAITGVWVFTPSSTLTSGDHTITATASNSNGASAASSAVTITIPATPVTPSSPPSAATNFSPADGSTIVDVTPTITGTADAGALIELLDGGTILVGADVADASGSWSITTAQLDPGTHTITVRAINGVSQTDTTLTLTR